MGRKQTNWREVAARDKTAAAMHEAAHATVAHYFGIEWESHLIFCGEATEGEKAWRGQLRVLSVPPGFHGSCVCWGGVVSDAWHFVDEEKRDAESLAWEARYLREDFPEDISETDERGIDFHPQQWRTCKTAARILIKRRAEWEWIAARLLEAGEADCHATAAAWTRKGSPRTRQAH